MSSLSSKQSFCILFSLGIDLSKLNFSATHFNHCETDPCLNGGSCINAGLHLFECECPQGFYGALCESCKL